MIRKLLFVLLPVLVLVSGCDKHSFNKPKLDSLFVTLNAHEQNMGSIAIADNGTIVYQNAFGYSRVNGAVKTPADVHTKYRVGSITKMFTAVMIPGGAGAIVATPTDLVNFIDALFAGKLINNENLEHMKQMRDNFGMAMFIFPFDDKTGYGHSGGIDGFLSQLIYYSADKLSVAYVANGIRYPTNEVVTDALSIYFNKPFVMPEFKIVKLTSTDLDKYLGNYTSANMPLKIAITKKNTTLMGQAAGHSVYPLDAKGNGRFVLDLAGVVFQFDTVKHSFYYVQNGETYFFTRVK